MDLSQVKAFLAVAEQRSFTKAAQSLHLSQPSISLKVKALEKHLHTQLIKRDQNKVYLSEDGEYACEKFQAIIKDLESLEDHFISRDKNKGLTITILHESDIKIDAIKHLIENTKLHFPDALINTVTCKSIKEIADKVSNDIYSIGLTKQSASLQNVRTSHWLTEEFMLVCQKDYINKDLSVDLSTLLDEKIWLPELESDNLKLLASRLRPFGLDINDFTHRSHIDEALIPDLVGAGDGIGIRLCNSNESNLCNYIRINEFATPYGLFLHINNKLFKDNSLFLDCLFQSKPHSKQKLIPIIERDKKQFNEILSQNKDKSNNSKLVQVGIQSRTIQTVISGRAMQKLGLFESFISQSKSTEARGMVAKWNDYKSAAPILDAMQKGELDIAIIGDYAISHMANSISTEDKPILVSFVSINPCGSGSSLLIRKNTGITGLSNLKYQSIAVPFLSTAHGSLLYNMVQNDMMNTTRLININLENNGRLNTFEFQADGLACFTPFDHFMAADQHFQKCSDEVSTPFSYYGVVVREKFAIQHSDIVVAFLKAMLCANYWFHTTNSAINHLSRWTGVSTRFVNSILGERSGNDGHYIPDMTIRPDWIKEYTENIFVSAQETSLDVNAKKMPQIETEFLDTAMKELGMVNY